MRKLISDTGGYQTYMELRPLTNAAHAGWYNFRVISVWQGARSTVEEHVKALLEILPQLKFDKTRTILTTKENKIWSEEMLQLFE